MSFASLYDHITHLDAVLTGKSMSEVAHNARHQAHLFRDMIEFVTHQHCYYLSDSGYSRVFVTDEGEIFLTSNSRDAVKAMWKTPEAVGPRKASGRLWWRWWRKQFALTTAEPPQPREIVFNGLTVRFKPPQARLASSASSKTRAEVYLHTDDPRAAVRQRGDMSLCLLFHLQLDHLSIRTHDPVAIV